MDLCYPPFDLRDWRSLPAFEARQATAEDVVRCRAIFAITGGLAEPVSTPGLPALAILNMEDGNTTRVVIVQMETQVGWTDPVVGYVMPEGGSGVATFAEFKVIEYAGD